MKENQTKLYRTEELAKKVTDYAFAHSTPLPAHIAAQHAWGSEQPDAGYMISPLQAQFHLWMAKAVGTKRILEIGCYLGFSALGWSQAVGPDGHVTTLEFSPEYAATARETLAKNGATNVEVIVGDANESLRKLAATLTEPYDLIFIDADKPSYPNYLALVLSLSTPDTPVRLLKKGGIIAADNILRRGLVAEQADADRSTLKLSEAGNRGADMALKELDQFNKDLVGSERVDAFLLPLFDGLGLGRLKD